MTRKARRKTSKSTTMRVLVVEDSLAVQAYLAAILYRAGFEVNAETNGDVAFKRYRASGPYSLVLTDMGHDGMDGFDLVNAIRRQNRTQAIVVVTGDLYCVPQRFRQRFTDIAVLEMPFRMRQLLLVVGTALTERQIELPTATSAMNKRILVVNNEPAVRVFAWAMLTAAGYQCRFATNGVEALAILESGERFDLLLSNFPMPEINGMELLERTRESFSDMPFVFESGCKDFSRFLSALKMGTCDYLRRPFEPAQSLAVVRYAFALEYRRPKLEDRALRASPKNKGPRAGSKEKTAKRRGDLLLKMLIASRRKKPRPHPITSRSHTRAAPKIKTPR
jgi:DNA-binding NtrC family response regulator